ncbi:MAG: DUF86 domain-containing protein [Actinobacteria bacterium]|nr:DUF86 domain-containing protein [Actinomycetota bacterium]
MTPPEDRARLAHLREAAEKAVGFSQGKTRQSLADDELLRLALTKLVEIVGEAAKHVSEQTREAYPSVPWSAAARMRDRLVHHYFDIDVDVLWATVSEDLPALLVGLPDAEDIPD